MAHLFIFDNDFFGKKLIKNPLEKKPRKLYNIMRYGYALAYFG